MFDSRLFDDLEAVMASIVEQRDQIGLADGDRLADAARSLQRVMNAAGGVQTLLLARIGDMGVFEDDGAPTVKSWAAGELGISTREAGKRVAAGRLLEELPATADAYVRGEITSQHVGELVAARRSLGADTVVEAEHLLLPLAKEAAPVAVRNAVEHLGNVVYPDALNAQWAAGMDKQDIQATPCGDGVHVNGFLDIETGMAFNAFLKTASAGHGPDDTRAPAQRRVDALAGLLDHGIAAGKPGNGLTPQLHVLCELDTLRTATNDTATNDTAGSGGEPVVPAEIPGYGPIGNDLLAYLACNGVVTPVLTDTDSGGDGQLPQASILNVGRNQRLATTKQRSAIIARQHGQCANPTCTNTQLVIHHVAWWNRDDGRTDLDNLVGICRRCHTLIHQHKLTIEPDDDGRFSFRRRTGKRILDHRQYTSTRLRRLLYR